MQAASTTQCQKNKELNQRVGKRPKQTFLQEGLQMDNKQVKRCLTLLIIREMQIRTSMSCHITPVRIGIIKKPTNNNRWRGCGEREHSCTVGGNVNWYRHYGMWYGDSLKTKNKTTIWPNNPTPRHIPWGNQNWKRHIYPIVHCSHIYNSPNMEAT